jgi:hypothetical protein
MSHSLIVLSPEPEASSRPSGLNATDKTIVGVAGEGAHFPATGHIPQLDRLVPGAGGQQPPVGAERHGSDPVPGVAGEGAHFSATGHLPQLDRLSAEPEARSRPSGLNATDLTQSVWPERVRTSLPLATSHSLIVIHSPAWSRRPAAARRG